MASPYIRSCLPALVKLLSLSSMGITVVPWVACLEELEAVGIILPRTKA